MRITLPSDTLEEDLTYIREVAEGLDEERDHYHANEIETTLERIDALLERAKDRREKELEIEKKIASKEYEKALEAIEELEDDYGKCPEATRLRTKAETLQKL